MTKNLDTQTHTEVQRYYGETLESSDDLKTTACCTAEAPPDFVIAALADIHDEVLARYYGCGLVLPESLEGLSILDLGCGAGRDVYVLSRMVGPQGRVVGVDMTPEQLEVARRYQGYHAELYGFAESNVEFIEANIERLDEADLEDGSFDLIVSNCVLNLAVDKPAVLRSVHRLLKPGGEMYFSDIYADRRIPQDLANDPVLYGECLSGALYWNDFLQIAKAAGFHDPRLLTREPVDVTDPELSKKLGELVFDSATFRLFKLGELEPEREDYGQQAVYKGTIPEHPNQLRLDGQFVFKTGEKTAICGTTFRLLEKSRFSDHFELFGDYSVHLGTFSDESVDGQVPEPAAEKPVSGCC